MDTVLEEIKQGGTTVRSKVEDAIMRDAMHETLTGEKTDRDLNKIANFKVMFVKYIKLINQIFSSNLDIVCYLSMMMTTFISPGILTMVYPLSIFGYAIIEETKPGKKYWLSVVLYTQIIIICEFIITFDFWQKDIGTQNFEDNNFELNCILFQTGFNILHYKNGKLYLLYFFMPKIAILWSAMTFLHNEIILDLYEEKEQNKESIGEAYTRYIRYRYGFDVTDINKMNENLMLQQKMRMNNADYRAEFTEIL